MAYPDDFLVELARISPSLAEDKNELEEFLIQEQIQSKVIGGEYDPARLLSHQWLTKKSGDVFKTFSEIDKDWHEYKDFASTETPSMKEWLALKAEIRGLKGGQNLNVNRKSAIDIFSRLRSVADYMAENKILIDELIFFNLLLSYHANALESSFDKIIKKYFAEYFNKKNKDILSIILNPKESGVEFGLVAKIEFSDKETDVRHNIHFYCKVNHVSDYFNGEIDPKELFIYKVLELTGNGPKVHFITDETSGWLCIATQDLSFSKSLNKNKKFTSFEGLQSEIQNSRDLYTAINRNEILSRVFRLDDIMDNFHNFGMVKISENRSKWKIVDFSVKSKSNYKINNPFSAFIKKTGMYKYTGIIEHALTALDQAEAVNVYSSLLDEFKRGKLSLNSSKHKLPLIDAIKIAYCETVRFMIFYAKNHHLSSLKASVGDIDQNSLEDKDILHFLDSHQVNEIGDIGRYVKASLLHANGFMQGLEKYIFTPTEEKDQSASNIKDVGSAFPDTQLLLNFFKEQNSRDLIRSNEPSRTGAKSTESNSLSSSLPSAFFNTNNSNNSSLEGTPILGSTPDNDSPNAKIGLEKK